MRTTVDIPDDLIARAISASGAKSKREAICWALEEAVRHQAVEEILTRKTIIDFAISPEVLEAREVREQYGKKRRRRPR